MSGAKRIAWTSILDCTNSGPRATLSNAVTAIQRDPMLGPDLIWYDEFKDQILTANSPTRQWRDDDDARVTIHLQQSVGISTIAETVVSSAIRHVARQRTRHCVRDAIIDTAWDGLPRIVRALERYWGAEPGPQQPLDYIRAISGNMLIGLIARVFDPGCHLDNMVVFEGPQGIGKSKALRVLGGPHYMLAAESVASKDFFQALRGAWLVEIGELDAFSRAERERVKVAISTPTDKYRSSYGRYVREHPRQCIFAGTTNRDDWGNDDTGLRRFWPLRCGLIDISALAADRAQLFAEALICYRSGQSWWETPSVATALVQGERQHDDAWTDSVLNWLIGKTEVTSTEILTGALKFKEADIGRPEQNRIGSILRLAGWRRQTIRRDNRPIKAWIDVTVDTNVTFE